MAVNRHPGYASMWLVALICAVSVAAMLGAWWVSFSAMPEGTSLVIHVGVVVMLLWLFCVAVNGAILAGAIGRAIARSAARKVSPPGPSLVERRRSQARRNDHAVELRVVDINGVRPARRHWHRRS